MKALWITASAVLGVALAGIIVFGSYGGFRKVNFEIVEGGGDTLVYRYMTGDYALSGEVMDEVYNVLKDDYGVLTTKGFGIYFDNPRQVAKDSLRYEAGCILSGADSEMIASIDERYEIKMLPKGEYLTTSFPYKGKASVIVAIMKVYPAMARYFEKNGMLDRYGAVMEIYDIPQGKILYRTHLLDAAPDAELPEAAQ